MAIGKKLKVGVSVFISFGVIITILFFQAEKPPLHEIEEARKNLAKAVECGGDKYAPVTFGESEEWFDSAMSCWERENRKLYFFRHFDQVKDYAGRSFHTADAAIREAVITSKDFKERVKWDIDNLFMDIGNYENIVKLVPLPEPMGEEYSRGKLLLSEAKHAYDRGQYQPCYEKLMMAKPLIDQTISYVKTYLTSYFENFNEWGKWVLKTIEKSKRNRSYAFVIDKMARECLIYYRGNLLHNLPVELGKNWLGDKQYRGDNTTPEGFYKVVAKLNGQSTQYYKALLIDYPNNEDEKQFKHAVKNGLLPDGAQIGGSIEIHGKGGKGVDWTEGCVALKDSDMDIAYSASQVGTPVTIVGSLKPLDEIVQLPNN